MFKKKSWHVKCWFSSWLMVGSCQFNTASMGCLLEAQQWLQSKSLSQWHWEKVKGSKNTTWENHLTTKKDREKEERKDWSWICWVPFLWGHLGPLDCAQLTIPHPQHQQLPPWKGQDRRRDTIPVSYFLISILSNEWNTLPITIHFLALQLVILPPPNIQKDRGTLFCSLMHYWNLEYI